MSLYANSQTLKQTLSKQYPNAEGILISKCKIESKLFIVTIQNQIDWWEIINIVRFSNHKIKWTAKFNNPPTSQTIHTATQISLPGFKNPLIEIFDVTHNGNGFHYLYELNGRNLIQLVSTIAIDDHDDGAIEINHQICSRFIKDGGLKPIYKDLNNDGFTDIKLKGTILINCDDFKKEHPAQKIFIYDKTKNEFIESLKLRTGFKRHDD